MAVRKPIDTSTLRDRIREISESQSKSLVRGQADIDKLRETVSKSINTARQAKINPIADISMGGAPVGHFPGDGHDHGDDPDYDPQKEAVFNQALQKLIAASGGKVKITSGKRSEKRQEELWAEALKKYKDPAIARKWVAMPRSAGGKGSNHTRGIAADLRFADDSVKKWVHENAAKYGLYFPLANEPWHIEIRGSRG